MQNIQSDICTDLFLIYKNLESTRKGTEKFTDKQTDAPPTYLGHQYEIINVYPVLCVNGVGWYNEAIQVLRNLGQVD